MKKVFLFATLAVATVFNLGYIAYGKYNAMSQADKLVFDNIEALSDGEGTDNEQYKCVGILGTCAIIQDENGTLVAKIHGRIKEL